MSDSSRKCLYCQGENSVTAGDVNNVNCKHCGMELPKKHPQDKKSKIRFFIKMFLVIVIFCVVMMYYLPR